MADRQTQFDSAAAQFRQCIGHLWATFNRTFPDGYLLTDEDPITGQAWDYPVKPVAGAIDDVLGSFDAVQVAIGLPPGEPTRHRAFLYPHEARKANP